MVHGFKHILVGFATQIWLRNSFLFNAFCLFKGCQFKILRLQIYRCTIQELIELRIKDDLVYRNDLRDNPQYEVRFLALRLKNCLSRTFQHIHRLHMASFVFFIVLCLFRVLFPEIHLRYFN